MAISIDYATKVISIPKADLSLVQSVPTEIRELDLNAFRLELKDWEDSENGIFMPDTHINNPPVNVGGVSLARVITLINGYTVTFEDGQYAVNLTGANSNVGDNVNVNQVSVRSANSAGLVQSDEIEFASFEGGVWYQSTSTTSGTVYPAGTRRAPVNNMADALIIAQSRGLYKFHLLDAVTLTTYDYSGYSFEGTDPSTVVVTVDASATVTGCEFKYVTLTGNLDAGLIIRECILSTVDNLAGFVERSVLDAAIFTLGGGSVTHFLDCWSGVPGTGTPTIDMGGSGQPMALRGYNGGVELTNKTGTESVSIDLVSGQVVIADTVINGTIVLRGVGKWTNVDTYAGTADVVDELVKASDILLAATSASSAAVSAAAAESAALDAETAVFNVPGFVWSEVLGAGNSAENELLRSRQAAELARNLSA